MADSERERVNERKKRRDDVWETFPSCSLISLGVPCSLGAFMQVASTIIGATSLPQLKENLDAWGQHNALPDSALEAIEEVFAKYRDPAKA